MKKLFTIMCFSLILSAITHVSFGHERAKEIKTEYSFCADVQHSFINVAVVDSSTMFVVASTEVVAPAIYINEFVSFSRASNLFIETYPPLRTFDHGLYLNSSATSNILNSPTSTHNNECATIRQTFEPYDHGIYIPVVKLIYKAPFVDDRYKWKFSVEHNC